MITKSLDTIQVENDVERLIILRKRLGKDQYEFAREIGVTNNYLNAIENYRVPFPDKLKKKINLYLEQHNKE